MGKNEFEAALMTVKKALHKFAEWGLTAGFVYTTEDGLLKFYGSEAVGDLINKNQASITSHPAFSHRQSEDEPDYIPEEAGRMVSHLQKNNFCLCQYCVLEMLVIS